MKRYSYIGGALYDNFLGRYASDNREEKEILKRLHTTDKTKSKPTEEELFANNVLLATKRINASDELAFAIHHRTDDVFKKAYKDIFREDIDDDVLYNLYKYRKQIIPNKYPTERSWNLDKQNYHIPPKYDVAELPQTSSPGLLNTFKSYLGLR